MKNLLFRSFWHSFFKPFFLGFSIVFSSHFFDFLGARMLRYAYNSNVVSCCWKISFWVTSGLPKWPHNPEKEWLLTSWNLSERERKARSSARRSIALRGEVRTGRCWAWLGVKKLKEVCLRTAWSGGTDSLLFQNETAVSFPDWTLLWVTKLEEGDCC